MKDAPGSAHYDGREYDAVVASGEQITSGLLAIVLQSIGIKARSWQGWQIPVVTDGAHRAARITGVAVETLKARLMQGEVAVVAGFQGSDPTVASAPWGAAAPTRARWRLPRR